MIGEVEYDSLLEQFVDRVPQDTVQPSLACHVMGKLVGMRQRQWRLEPLGDRQHRSPLPGQHRRQKFVFLPRRKLLDVDAPDRLIKVRLQLIAQLRVAHYQIDLFRVG